MKRAEDEQASAWMLRFDREQLYEEVWSAPTQQVAKRYGISDAAIGKVCRCLKIPKPPRGYWAKKAAGRERNARPKLARSQRAGGGKARVRGNPTAPRTSGGHRTLVQPRITRIRHTAAIGIDAQRAPDASAVRNPGNDSRADLRVPVPCCAETEP